MNHHYIPSYGYISHCYEDYWGAGKHDDGPLRHQTVYPALLDLGLTGFRLDLWENILTKKSII